MTRLLHRSSDAIVLALLVAGALGMWVGVPLAWLWVGSQVQGATHSVGVAVLAMLLGAIATVALVIAGLVWLADRHRAIQLAQGREDPGRFALEAVLTVSAMIALGVFAVWFLFFAGATPLPFYGRGA